MSCRILLDNTESIGFTSHSNISPIGKRNGNSNNNQTYQRLLSYLARALYFRRLNPIKIYMATVIVIILLFITFSPLIHKSSNAETNQASDIHLNHAQSQMPTPDRRAQAHSAGADQDQNAQIMTSTRRQQTSLSPLLSSRNSHIDKILTSHRLYPNNLTYSLSVKDFTQLTPNLMQVRIREATKHSWDNYRRYAWGYDMLKPRAKEPDHWFHLGLTIVDSADTLIMMGLTHESNMALDWIENEMKTTSKNENSNCFELTIRILAGLLSAYHLTGREKIKQQAIDMGDVLMHCYDTESRVIPYSDIDLNTKRAHPPPWNPHSSLSEIASLQLEFRYLSQISGNPIYEETTFKTSSYLHNLTATRPHKLLPMYINPTTGQLEDGLITLGARTDSYYEYLLKQYLQTGIKWFETDYLDSVDDIRSRLVLHTNGPRNYTYVAELTLYKTSNNTDDPKYHQKMDHLVCFLPGTLALGYYHYSPLAAEIRLRHNLETPRHKLNSRYDYHIDLARGLARTCYHMYKDMGTGLAPEIARFVHHTDEEPLVSGQPELQSQPNAAYNILRPEFVESLFYLYHITGLPVYRREAEEIFEAFQNYSRIPSGYSAVSDVRVKPAPDADLDELLHKSAPDRMESFWISETLKYLYLTFCDDRNIVGTLLNYYVFNTEAHILPIIT